MLLAWIHKRTTGTTNELKWLWEYFKISSVYDPQAICKWYCYSIPEGCSCPAGHTWESPQQWACLPLLWREEGARRAHPEAQRAMGTGPFLAPMETGRAEAPQRIVVDIFSREFTWSHRQCTETLPSALTQVFCSPLPHFACRKSLVHRPIVVIKATEECFC